MQVITLKYSLKVWLTSVVAAPALIILLFFGSAILNDRGLLKTLYGGIMIYVFLVIAELICSAATVIIFLIVTEVSARIINDVILRKWIIFTAGILPTGVTFFAFVPDTCFNFNFSRDNLVFFFLSCNSLCIGSATWIYSPGLIDVDFKYAFLEYDINFCLS